MKCTRCDAKAVWNQPGLCAKHFDERFLENVRATITKYALLPEPNTDAAEKVRICVAASGGKDSLSTIDVLRRLGYKHIEALAIDEGICGYREHTLKDLKAYCDKQKIPLTILSFKEHTGKELDEWITSKKSKGSTKRPCTICGIFRRKLLNQGARDMHADVIATGHNADDEAQVVLMNLFRANTAIFTRPGPKTGSPDVATRHSAEAFTHATPLTSSAPGAIAKALCNRTSFLASGLRLRPQKTKHSGAAMAPSATTATTSLAGRRRSPRPVQSHRRNTVHRLGGGARSSQGGGDADGVCVDGVRAESGVGNGVFTKGVFTQRIKPLYRCAEREVMTYALLQQLGVGFHECPYVEQSYRDLVRNALNKHARTHPEVRDNILDRFLALRARDPPSSTRLKACTSCGEPAQQELCAACLLLEQEN